MTAVTPSGFQISSSWWNSRSDGIFEPWAPRLFDVANSQMWIYSIISPTASLYVLPTSRDSSLLNGSRRRVSSCPILWTTYPRLGMETIRQSFHASWAAFTAASYCSGLAIRTVAIPSPLKGLMGVNASPCPACHWPSNTPSVSAVIPISFSHAYSGYNNSQYLITNNRIWDKRASHQLNYKISFWFKKF